MSVDNPGRLLRSKAVTHRLMGPPSTPVIALARHLKLQLLFWLILLICATYLLTKTSYKETVSARGILEPVEGIQEIVSPVAARIVQIHVTKGASVREGDILATLSSGPYNAEGMSALEETRQQLLADKALLIKQLNIQQQLQQQSRHWRKIASQNMLSSKQNLEREVELVQRRAQLSDRNLEAISALVNSGNGSAREYDLHYQRHLELLGLEQTLTRKLLQFDHELNSLSNIERREGINSQQASLRIQQELQQIEQKITNLKNRASLTVVAQRPGIVAELALDLGTPVLPNQPLFYINPLTTELKATLYVPASVQAKLAVGQAVLLSYDAFDYRLYGRQKATLSSVGHARLDPRKTQLPVFGLNEPVFKVTAALDSLTLDGEPPYLLQSGATLLADFVLSDMTLLQFIFKPLLGLQGKVT
jgi:membrane fusion protein